MRYPHSLFVYKLIRSRASAKVNLEQRVVHAEIECSSFAMPVNAGIAQPLTPFGVAIRLAAAQLRA
jgi:hypothetical protein